MYSVFTEEDCPCEDFVKEYMDVQKQTFTEGTIKQAWKKSSLKPFNPDIFNDHDFAMSIPTSIHAHVPDSFPIPTQHTVPSNDTSLDKEESESESDSNSELSESDSDDSDTEDKSSEGFYGLIEAARPDANNDPPSPAIPTPVVLPPQSVPLSETKFQPVPVELCYSDHSTLAPT